jgi:hypothetical protein
VTQGRLTSIVEIGRFDLRQFTVEIKELAECFGLELPRIHWRNNWPEFA